ncbi:hypothetical protein [Kurthia huakuii]|uniref:hypothetical protein n=1 Tax=Kurthia huakuii TaxID=1421019 RepID=UPI000496A2CC|nr:hypothetical protein [Kurthia huakuii]MBM7698952.1 hypothetical protein [Kurthia huakuii]
MKLAAILNNRYAEIENRKRVLKQKTADEAYKKNAQYFQPKSNQALDELVDLLTGKKEQQAKPALQQAIREMQEAAPSDSAMNDLVANDEEAVDILKRVQQSALSSANPTAQDLQVAQSAADYIAQKTPFTTNSDIATLAPKKNVDSLHVQPSEQQYKETIRTRLFEKAASRYQFQIQMARSGFQFDEPVFYQIA